MTKTILLVPDGRPEVGFGHISRCLTLGERLRRQGMKAMVFLPNNPKTIKAVFGRLPVLTGKNPLAAARRIGAHGVVLDGYGFPARWAAGMARAGLKVFLIDDLGQPRRPVDFVVNPNMHARTLRYRNKSLLGPRYALLRDEIITLRKRDVALGTPPNLFVCMGGADPTGVTPVVLESLRQLSQSGTSFSATIVMGPSAGRDVIENVRRILCEAAYPHSLECAPPDFATLLAESDIAVVSGGVVLTESLMLGIPSIALILADNQEDNVNAWVREGAVLNASIQPPDIADKIKVLLGSEDIRRSLRRNAGRLLDGRGAKRVASAILDTLL